MGCTVSAAELVCWWAAAHLRHLVHRHWNAIYSQRGQIRVDVLLDRCMFCQRSFQVLQDHTLILAYLGE